MPARPRGVALGIGELMAAEKAATGAATILASAIAILLAIAQSAIGQEQDISISRDIHYRSVGGTTLALDAYTPVGPGPHPAVIIIPGGKWVNVDKDDSTWLPIDLAKIGIAAFPVNYRPATRAPFPAALEDVEAAVRFLRARAAHFDIDPARIGAVGASAGGHLAALLATWGEGPTDTGSRVRVAISWSGPMDLEQLLGVRRNDLNGIVRTFLGCSTTEPCLDQARTASPIRHVDPSDGAVYLGNGTEEIIPLTQATAMQAELQENDVPTQLVAITGGGHGYGNNEKTLSPAFAFLGARLGIQGASLPSSSPEPEKPGSVASSSAVVVPDSKVESSTTRTTGVGTPWWAIVTIVIASVAAVASLIVSMSLVRRSRQDELRSTGRATDDRPEPDTPSDRPLAVRGTDPPE
jgi:acetyl esterase/lipase